MKQQIHIVIDIDTEREGKTCAEAGKHIVDEIFVRSDIIREVGADGVFAAALHELGHVMAQRFGLTAHQKDPRMNRDLSMMPYSPRNIYDAEVEAWNVAERVFNAAREYALGTYKRVVYPPWDYPYLPPEKQQKWDTVVYEDILKSMPKQETPCESPK